MGKQQRGEKVTKERNEDTPLVVSICLGILLLVFGVSVTLGSTGKWVHFGSDEVVAYTFHEEDNDVRLYIETKEDYRSFRDHANPFDSIPHFTYVVSDSDTMYLTELYREKEQHTRWFIVHVPKDEKKAFMKAYYEHEDSPSTPLDETELREVEDETGIPLFDVEELSKYKLKERGEND